MGNLTLRDSEGAVARDAIEHFLQDAERKKHAIVSIESANLPNELILELLEQRVSFNNMAMLKNCLPLYVAKVGKFC